MPNKGGRFITTPIWLSRKHATINVKNVGNDCIKWSILASLHPAIHNAQNKFTYRRYENEINLEGINLPLQLNSHTFDKIEKQNPHISLNIYKYEKKSKKSHKKGTRQNIIVYPFRVSTRRSSETYKEVNLLILHDENDNENFHFVTIKSLSKLVTAAYSKKKTKHIHVDTVCSVLPNQLN